MENGKRPPIIRGLIVFFALITIFAVVGFMLPLRSEVASEEGKGIDAVITYLLWATGALVIIGHVVLIRFLLVGRDKQAAPYHRPPAKVEWMWGLIPVLVMMLVAEAGVLVVGNPTWDKLYVERAEDPLDVEVVGKQFEWLIRYPGKDGTYGKYDFAEVHGEDNPMGLVESDDAAADDVFSRNVLYLPLGRPVRIKMRTHDVIHSFFVPEFRVKQDIIPGFETELRFTPTRVGEYELVCTELCGLGHYTMRGVVHVVEPAEFEAWLAKREIYFPED
ncbi:MAG: cytochrome c oxidase subunit II [Planctomycetota bacterium]|jgi:cytochrome c oxidase subunit 2